MTNYITKEDFIREVKALGYGIVDDVRMIAVVSRENIDHSIAIIYKDDLMALDTDYLNWRKIGNNKIKTKLYNLLDRYARTPLDKREPEKRYWLTFDVSDRIKQKYYLCLHGCDYCLEITKYPERFGSHSKVIFTQSEIDAMGDLTKGFVKEEV